MNKYLLEARKIHKKAIEEFEHGKLYSDKMIIRNAAEKAWLAAVKAIDALLYKHGIEVPIGREAHIIRNQKLAEWVETDSEIRKIRDCFSLIRDILHGGCFYYGYCPINDTELKIKATVKKLIDYIENYNNSK